MTDRMTVSEYREMLNKPAKAKYKNKPNYVDGLYFPSMKEANRFSELKLLHKAGKIKDLQLQVTFELIPKSKTERAVKYIADFVYSENDKQIVEDVKSSVTKTPVYILKRKLFKLHYLNYIFRETY